MVELKNSDQWRSVGLIKVEYKFLLRPVHNNSSSRVSSLSDGLIRARIWLRMGWFSFVLNLQSRLSILFRLDLVVIYISVFLFWGFMIAIHAVIYKIVIVFAVILFIFLFLIYIWYSWFCRFISPCAVPWLHLLQELTCIFSGILVAFLLLLHALEASYGYSLHLHMKRYFSYIFCLSHCGL